MTTQPRPQTFRGRSVAEAMKKVVAELGRDAFILDKRHVREKRLGGLLGGEELVEIIATSETMPARQEEPRRRGVLLERTYGSPLMEEDDPATPYSAAPQAGRVPLLPQTEDVLASSRAEAASVSSAAPFSPAPVAALSAAAPVTPAVTGISGAAAGHAAGELVGDAVLQSVRGEILKLMATQARGGAPAVSERLLDLYHRLVENDVAADIARRLVEELQAAMPGVEQLGEEAVRQALCEAIGRLIPTSGPIRLKSGGPTIVALVGPTGVGKTTTVVKLAFEFKLRQNRRVALLTEDLHRPGAEAQLRSMAQVLGVPLYTVDSLDRVNETIARLGESDLILIDTAGRTPRDKEGMGQLGSFLRTVKPDETHLVLSGESSERFARDVAECFKAVGYDRIVLSKLDEAASYGLILNVASRVAAALSYVTTGQEVATTIRLSDQTLLARLVAGVDRIGIGGDAGLSGA